MRVSNGDLPREFFLNGDAAYNVGDQMVVPYGSNIDPNFDYVQSSNRIVFERTIGVVIRRCPLYHSPLSLTEIKRMKVAISKASILFLPV